MQAALEGAEGVRSGPAGASSRNRGQKAACRGERQHPPLWERTFTVSSIFSSRKLLKEDKQVIPTMSSTPCDSDRCSTLNPLSTCDTTNSPFRPVYH